MTNKVELTKKGKQELEQEYQNLINVVRDEVKQQLAEARAQGDLSENADYDAARDRQAQVESRIKEIENILANAVIIDEEVPRMKNKHFDAHDAATDYRPSDTFLINIVVLVDRSVLGIDECMTLMPVDTESFGKLMQVSKPGLPGFIGNRPAVAGIVVEREIQCPEA